MNVHDAGPSSLVFLPLGGVGEIGMNLALYGVGTEADRKWIMVDCGLTFGDAKTLPGIDLVFPDIAFIEEERHNLLGIVITHAHEDHYGALQLLWPRLGAPVYATAFVAGLIEAKAVENQVRERVPVTVVRQGETLTLDPFAIEFVPVSHSIPEPNALVIRTPHGTVVHSGDWKLDPEPGIGLATDVERLRRVGDGGVRALICDSTNALRPGRSPSEADVASSLAEIVRAAPNRVAVTTFSSNVARIVAVARAAQAADRQVVLMGRALKRVVEVAGELGYLEGLPAFLSEDEFGYLPRDKVVVLLTGSQGEERAALARIALDDHPRVALSAGDLVIFSSRTIPGNEKAVNAVINGLSDMGIRVMTDADGLVHASGHPRQDELADLYGWLRPQVLVPVHGEPLHLARHEAFAKAQGIPHVVRARNGDMVRLAPDPPGVVDAVEVDVEILDGRLLLPAEHSGVRDRRALALAGCVAIMVLIDRRGDLVEDPDVLTFGIPDRDDEGRSLEDLLLDRVADAIESIPKARRRDPMTVAKAARRAARGLLAEVWGKKPLCEAVVRVV